MACEYHLSSRSSYLVKNAYSPSGSAICGPRMGSYRKPKEQPIIKVKCSTNSHNNVDNNNVSNCMTNSSSGKKTGMQETKLKPVSAPSPTMLGNNKSYYSSTRSFSSKCAANSVYGGGGSAGGGATASNGAIPSSFVRNSKTTSSSGNSSVESIAPKYGGLNGNSFDGGSKKRAYQTVRIPKKQAPVQLIEYANTRPYGTPAHNSKNSNKKQMTAHDTQLRSTIYNSFSTKFPKGLPFEDEFYHSRKRNSVKSENSDFSTAYESDQCPLPFEEEFSRCKSSTEPLYVDFSKRLPSKETNTSRITNDFFDKFDRASNYVCNPNEVIVQDQPVVHVAVTWWAPECQQFGTDLATSTYLNDM